MRLPTSTCMYFNRPEGNKASAVDSTDWKEIMEALTAIDYQGDFTYETHRYAQGIPNAMIPAAIRYSYELGQYLLSLAGNG